MFPPGRVRVTTTLMWVMEVDGAMRPHVGDIVAFGAVSAEHAALEGEDDGSLAAWRQGCWAFCSRECVRIGRVPSEEMPVVCAVFELLAQVSRPAP